MTALSSSSDSEVNALEAMPRMTNGLRMASAAAALFVMVCSCLVMIGYLTGSDVLTSLVPGAKSVQSSTAVSLAFLSAAYFLMQCDKGSSLATNGGRAAAGIIV